MAVVGFHCSHEQHAPSALLRYAQRAAEAGFTAGMCSDHFHPWSEREGHSGFAWSWLGAALEGTPMSFGTVCAPGQRYHPAVIAQAAATLAEMYPERLWLALGSGEALNEAITGDPWPAKPDRQIRLEESAETIRALWAGETVSIRMHTTTQGARLYSRPARPPLLVGAAVTPETARWVGSWADGLVTVGATPDRLRAVVDAFREEGGGKPMFLQVALAYAPTDADAERAAFEEWPHAALAPDQLANLASPAEFDRATATLRPEDVIARVPASADIERHIARLHELAALGFERLYLHNVARAHQDLFIDACGTTLLPALATRQEHVRA